MHIDLSLITVYTCFIKSCILSSFVIHILIFFNSYERDSKQTKQNEFNIQWMFTFLQLSTIYITK